MSAPPLHFLAAYGTLTSVPALVASAEELGTYSFWIRGTIREFLHFTARTLAGRTLTGKYLIVKLERYPFIAYSCSRSDGLVVVLIAAESYPETSAKKVVENALSHYPDMCWMLERQDVKEPCLQYVQLLARYQEDPIKLVQEKITIVKETARVVVEKLLEREERLETLVAQSEDLSAASKRFYAHAEDTNSCCWLWFGWRRHS